MLSLNLQLNHMHCQVIAIKFPNINLNMNWKLSKIESNAYFQLSIPAKNAINLNSGKSSFFLTKSMMQPDFETRHEKN